MKNIYIPCKYGWLALLLVAATALGYLLTSGSSRLAKAQVAPPDMYRATYQIDIQRLANSLLASVDQTTQPQQWSWLRTTAGKCQISDFHQASERSLWRRVGEQNRGYGHHVKLRPLDIYKTYCFYMKSGGMERVAAYKIWPPKVQIVHVGSGSATAQHLEAEITNSLTDKLTIGNWYWYRYRSVARSSFNCQPQNYGLNGAELRQATRLDRLGYPSPGAWATVDSYEDQKQVYKYGLGKRVNLTAADNGLTYCFIAKDLAGITGYRAYYVEINQPVAVPPSTSPEELEEPTAEAPSTSLEELEEPTDSAGTEVASVDTPTVEPTTKPVSELPDIPVVEPTKEPVRGVDQPIKPVVEVTAEPDSQLADQSEPRVINGQQTEPGNENQSHQAGAGQAGAEAVTGVNTDLEGIEENNWLAVIGVGIVLLALVVSGVWLIARSRLQDPEAEEEMGR